MKVVRFDEKGRDISLPDANQTGGNATTMPARTRSLRSRNKPVQELQEQPISTLTQPRPSEPKPKPKTTRRIKMSNRKIRNTDPMAKSIETSRIAASHELSLLREARRNALRNLQAEQDPRKTGLEPDLNDTSEVRHFEVDEQGSLTLIVFDDDTRDAWVLSEVPWDEEGVVQVVAGRAYRVTRV